jgi:hypothetical protein
MTIHPQDVHRIRDQIAGWLAVEPNRHIATSIDVPFFFADGELVAPVPVPAPPQPAPVPRRQRKPSLSKALREAKKAGIPVTGATFTADSVSLSFGEAAKSNGNDLDQWLAGRHENPAKRN